jgi:hypothetical protein
MKTNSPIQRIATPIRIFMTTLFILFAAVFVQMCVVEMAPVLWARRPAPAPTAEKELSPAQQRTQRIQHARKEFLPDGTLHLITRIGGPKWRPQYTPDPPTTQEQIYDVNDKLLWDGPIKERPYDYLAWAQYVRRDDFDARDMHRVQTVDPEMSILEFPVATGEKLLEKWRYSPWRDCFVGYSLEGEQLGYLGADGITDSKSQVRPFGPFGSFLAWWPPEAYSPMALWKTKRRLYQIDFDRQKVELIFESADSDIASIQISRWDSYRPERSMATAEDRQMLHCRTRGGAYHVILRDPNQTVTVRVPDEWRQWFGNYYQFAVTEQGLFLRRNWMEYPARPAYAGSEWRTKFLRTTKTWWVELYRISETGALDLVNRYRWTVPGESRSVASAASRDPRSYVQPHVTAFSGLAYDLAWTALRDRAGTSEWWGEGGQLLYELRPRYRVGSWLVMAVMLTLTFLHARSRCRSKAAFVFWLVFVALLNLAGFLVYWALNHTPLIICSTCGKRRGLGQTDCVRCGKPLPVPERGKLDLVFGV